MSQQLDTNQRQVIGEKLMELANLSYAALVVSQLLAQQINFRASLIGLLMFVSGYAAAVLFMTGGR